MFIFSQSKSKPAGYQSASVNEQALLEAIDAVINCKNVYLSEERIGSKEVAEGWNKMVNSLCNNRGKCVLHLGKVNDTLEDLTKMDYAKDLINHIRSQRSSLELLAASSEEMAASINEIASYAQSVASSSEEANKIAVNGSVNITNTIKFVEKAFGEIENVSAQMQEVNNKTGQINSIVHIVKEIADQTNMLALNAAIEAARAGEQGRGFAVVAEEVKKLADNTKSSVQEIQENIILLEDVVKKLSQRVLDTSGQLSEGRKLINSSLESMHDMTEKFEEVNKSVLQISANSEEQNTATDSFTKEIATIANFADTLYDEADKTGKAIFKVSKMCNDLKLNILTEDLHLDTKTMLDICKTDHLMWRWRVYNMTLGYDNIDVDTIGTHKDCRLGRWYGDQGMELFGYNQLFRQMEGPHGDLHKLAKEATLAYQSGEVNKAEEKLKEMDKCSDFIVNALNELKRSL